MFFWRDAAKTEVDIILPLNNTIIPVEVKYRTNIISSHMDGLLKFMKKHNSKKGILITKDILKETVHNPNLTIRNNEMRQISDSLILDKTEILQQSNMSHNDFTILQVPAWLLLLSVKG